MSITEAEFTDTVNQSRRQLTSVAYRILGNRADAEDAVQAALMAAWAGRDKYDPEKGAPGAWLSGFTTRQALNIRRERARWVPVGAWEDEFGFEFEDRTVEPTGLPCMADNETRERVMLALHKLPARQRHAVELHVLHGMTTAQAAHAMGISRSTVSGLLRCALSRLTATTEAPRAGVNRTVQVRAGVDSNEAELVRRQPEVLDALTPRQRDVLVLRYVQRLPIAAVAKRLGISGSTVRWTTAFARRRLHELPLEVAAA